MTAVLSKYAFRLTDDQTRSSGIQGLTAADVADVALVVVLHVRVIDAPVTVGLLIESSGSTRNVRNRVLAAQSPIKRSK